MINLKFLPRDVHGFYNEFFAHSLREKRSLVVFRKELGCVPLKDKGDYKGWFCPCHGSHYDVSGRIRKGPAPKNMEIPKFEFVDNNTIKIG